LTTEEANQISKRLVTKYGMQVPKEVALSVFTGQPKVPVLLSRASFRHVDVRTKERTQLQQARRKFLHTMLGFAAASVTGLLLLKIALPPSPQATPASLHPSSSSPGSNSPSPSSPQSTPNTSTPSSHSGQLLANATNIPLNQSLTFNDQH